ncbi:hypothetical protein N7449_011096 [Penicillium cf. viridicatum]|uniref:Uncharacterized protein n=1 Tax=Penicillium cf. viridicatum TaxID=2972119 RepID=A0A9W9IY80_9EURO|nr:hypothetical protein N7449_011096 [Penicillium cf. viridicatum]
MMRHLAVNSDPETPSLVASSYIALIQEGITTCEVISEADLPSRVTNDHQGPSTRSSAFSIELTPQSSHTGTHAVSSSPEADVTEGENQDSVKEAILAGVAGGVSEVYHSPLTDELFAASPATLALVECALLDRIAQMAVNMRSLEDDLEALKARWKQLAALRVVSGSSRSTCWSAGITPSESKV